MFIVNVLSYKQSNQNHHHKFFSMARLQCFTKPLLTLLLFLSFTLLISSINSQQAPPPLIPTSTDPTYYYNLCAPSTCNNFSLPYPINLPTPCQVSPVQTFCPSNETLLFTSPSDTDTFRVLSVNTTDPTATFLTVASNSLFTCGVQVSKPNYALQATIFRLPPVYKAGTHLNCTSPIPSGAIEGLQNASCLDCNTTTNFCYYAPSFDVNYANCEQYYVFNKVGDSFNVSIEGDLRAYLRSGFEVRADKPSDCRGCESSGGRCGSKPSTGSFVCYCPTSVHSFNCSDGILEDLSTWVNSPDGGGSGPSRAVIAAISGSVSVLFLVVLVALVVILARRRKLNFHFDKKTVSSISPKSIALDTAKGILYLHQGCRDRILHLDIKPSNVVLDSNFSAKVTDFGLAKMIDKDRSHVSLTAAQGTPGYAAPEMWLKTFGPVTEKSDVYSYGMLLLEMVGRRKNYESEMSESSQVYFPEWLYDKVEKDEFPFVTRRGDNDASFDENIVKRMCLVGLWCIQHIPSNRPSMDKIVLMLEGNVEIGIPPHPLRQKTTQSHESIFSDALV
ncbi:hypothetical protein IFM89_022327 [Coptis chinensis]|uniref:Protein kinase domain-containing protein n=1 Tax=Coptis chinensis TaxID=261450 RepID=A0A835I4E2_9MAGN|nr:hypothetical protein IFM89_022327 [Coptis chinensis]